MARVQPKRTLIRKSVQEGMLLRAPKKYMYHHLRYRAPGATTLCGKYADYEWVYQDLNGGYSKIVEMNEPIDENTRWRTFKVFPKAPSQVVVEFVRCLNCLRVTDHYRLGVRLRDQP